MTAIQEHTADAFQARIGAFAEAVTSAALGVGFVFGGVIAAVGTPRAVYVIAGLSTLALAAAPLVRHHATPTTRDPRSTRAQVA
jgi:hypothetical protein